MTEKNWKLSIECGDDEGGRYDCLQPWPVNTEGRAHEAHDHKASAMQAFLEDEAKENGQEPPPPLPKRYSFIAYPPAPENVTVRDRYYTGRGLQRPKIVVVGHGPDYEQAEQDSYNKYQVFANCKHSWYRPTMSNGPVVDGRRGPGAMLLDGDGYCSFCHIHVGNYFMDDMLHRAMNLAYEAHEGQFRKYGGAPYIGHPKQVYDRVAWQKVLPEEQWIRMACAAWLHDVLEDCPHIGEQRILLATNEAVLQLVKELTNPSKGSTASRAERKQMDRDHLLHVSWEAKFIKMLDRICNLRDMKQCPDKRFQAKYAAESRLLWECLKDTDELLSKELLSWVEANERWSQE